MSTILYANLTKRRKIVKTEDDKGKIPEILDGIAAIIPAEILTLHALALQFTTKTETNASGEAVTSITAAGTLVIAFFFLFVLCMVFYWVGAGFPNIRSWKIEEWARAIVPALAFVCWTMLQKSTAFDALAPSFTSPLRFILAAGIGYLLVKIAEALAKKANNEPPPAG
jgi:hypothetical protein